MNVMGIEDVTSYFHDGLAESGAPNPLSQRGIATHVTLDASRPPVINYLFGVASIPPRFDRVESIEPSLSGVALISSSGKRAKATVDIIWNPSA